MRCYAPGPDGGANSAPLDHLVGFRGEEGKGEREEKGIGKGRGRKKGNGKGSEREKKGRKGDGDKRRKGRKEEKVKGKGGILCSCFFRKNPAVQ